jgi:hypothetical protein
LEWQQAFVGLFQWIIGGLLKQDYEPKSTAFDYLQPNISFDVD